jgi:hypothetical protein
MRLAVVSNDAKPFQSSKFLQKAYPLWPLTPFEVVGGLADALLKET